MAKNRSPFRELVELARQLLRERYPNGKPRPLNHIFEETEYKALDSLARHKYMMFGYWAAIHIYLSRGRATADDVQEARRKLSLS